MITRIGIVAGEIWNYLDNHNRSATITEFESDLQKPRDLILMSVGWLAREGHVVVDGDFPNYVIKLK
ncbi:MAG: winged helix-turn-helix domain-containing protein [Candidatus Omnitrophota bacterium]|nr:winged helix-turn-helix domain-containing protein [Candidatus Omnitrophota bacterium]